MQILYECLFVIGLLLYLPKALWRRRLPHPGWSMRLGRYPRSVSESLGGRPAIWVHAVSVGEVQAAGPLLQALHQAYPQAPLVLSTITEGGFQVAAKQLGARAVPVYFPLDLSGCVRAALETIRPRILLLVESEFWPTVIRLTHARGVPIIVVNGRISSRAFRRARWIAPWIGGWLRRIDLFLMQSQTDADRVLALGAPPDRVRVVGNLKWDASVGSRPSPQLIHDTGARLGLNGRQPVIVAGSTHRGEEQALLQAFHALRMSHPDARLILAPRHLERLAEVEHLVRQAGLTATRLSRGSDMPAGSRAGGTAPPSQWDVGLVDAFGQLSVYYGLAAVVFIGGSLIPHGGQNPLEAASLGKPVVFGPLMQNFEAIAHQLLAHHAARQVGSAQELGALLTGLLDHPADAEAMGRRAQELTERFQGATRRMLEAVQPFLEHPERRVVP